MSKLLKLYISGIRSFGPYEDDVQQIKFTTPLTLFLGQNGCGKTTIIEAIRYACTGELPGGTTSGQGFVNDPKMSGKSVTKGQIRLKFTDTRENEITVCRIVEVCQRANTLKFSSKAPTIRLVKRNGEDESISGRCADVTSYCCQVLNVSPSVLNNVIFCHQENSSWPLDEGKKLKEKFDEIFDAQKYNKCIELLRKQLKEKQDNTKTLKLELSYRSDRKQAVEKDKRKLEDKKDKLKSLNADISSKQEEINPVNERIEEICELENTLGDLQKKLATKEETKKGLIEQQNTIKKNITSEFEGTDEELRNEITTFELNRQKDENMIVDLEKRKTDIEQKNKAIDNAVQELQNEIGRFNQEKIQYQNKCIERKNLIEKAKMQMNIQSFTEYDIPKDVKIIVSELKAALETSQDSLNDLIEEKDTEELNLQKSIDGIREKFVSTKQIMESKRNEIKNSGNKISEISDELKSISTSDEILKKVTSKLDEIDKTIFNLKNMCDEISENKKIEEYKREIQNKENEVEALERDVRTLQQNDVIEGKLESEKQTIMEKMKFITKIRSKHLSSLNHLFRENIPKNNLKTEVEVLQNKENAIVKDLMDKLNTKQKEVTLGEAKRNNQLEKIKSCESELKNKKEKIFETCNGKNFNEFIKSVHQKKEELQNDKGQYSSAKIIYEMFLQEFEKDAPCCPVCQTDFVQKKSAVVEIINNIRSKLEKIPKQLVVVETELKKEEETYSKLQQLRSVNEDVEMLDNVKLPILNDELENITRDLTVSTDELQDLKIKLEIPQKNVEICRNIISDIASLDQNQIDITKSEETIEYLKREIVTVASNKSKQEIEAEIDTLKSDINDLRRNIETLSKKISNHKDRLQQVIQERSMTLTKQMNLQRNIQSKPHLENQKDELTEKIQNLKKEMVKLESNLNVLNTELDNAIEKKKNIVKENKDFVSRERNRINSNKKAVEDVEKVQNEIDVYLRNQIEEKLTKTENELKELKQKAETLEQTKNKIVELISSKKENLAKQELNFRSLQNNLILREKRELGKKLESEIADLKKQIGDFNYRSVYNEKQRLIAKCDVLQKEINGIIGQKKELTLSIDELEQELNKPQNKEAHKQYMSKFYQLSIAQAVIQDLNKYIVALEKSILEFHKTRMIEINKTIREYWRNIYRGNDIDYIEIKTEYASSNVYKRSYNYKVVQVKKGIELDMRGRCSAGQKVLACLIIRMALAETLSANCGILALDEPTTNLDRENIQSLSDTLSRIVSNRQNEKNFQLLIITHDEEFLNTLTRMQSVSYFYKVSRNNDGFSVIQKEYTL